MTLGEAIAILNEFVRVAGNDAEMSVSSFNLQGRVDSVYDGGYQRNYYDKPKRKTTYQIIASYPQTNNYDHIPVQPEKEIA